MDPQNPVTPEEHQTHGGILVDKKEQDGKVVTPEQGLSQGNVTEILKWVPTKSPVIIDKSKKSDTQSDQK